MGHWNLEIALLLQPHRSRRGSSLLSYRGRMIACATHVPRCNAGEETVGWLALCPLYESASCSQGRVVIGGFVHRNRGETHTGQTGPAILAGVGPVIAAPSRGQDGNRRLVLFSPLARMQKGRYSLILRSKQANGWSTLQNPCCSSVVGLLQLHSLSSHVSLVYVCSLAGRLPFDSLFPRFADVSLSIAGLSLLPIVSFLCSRLALEAL